MNKSFYRLYESMLKRKHNQVRVEITDEEIILRLYQAATMFYDWFITEFHFHNNNMYVTYDEY